MFVRSFFWCYGFNWSLILKFVCSFLFYLNISMLMQKKLSYSLCVVWLILFPLLQFVSFSFVFSVYFHWVVALVGVEDWYRFGSTYCEMTTIFINFCICWVCFALSFFSLITSLCLDIGITWCWNWIIWQDYRRSVPSRCQWMFLSKCFLDEESYSWKVETEFSLNMFNCSFTYDYMIWDVVW